MHKLFRRPRPVLSYSNALSNHGQQMSPESSVSNSAQQRTVSTQLLQKASVSPSLRFTAVLIFRKPLKLTFRLSLICPLPQVSPPFPCQRLYLDGVFPLVCSSLDLLSRTSSSLALHSGLSVGLGFLPSGSGEAVIRTENWSKHRRSVETRQDAADQTVKDAF